jgi:hypothetical protein
MSRIDQSSSKARVGARIQQDLEEGAFWSQAKALDKTPRGGCAKPRARAKLEGGQRETGGDPCRCLPTQC